MSYQLKRSAPSAQGVDATAISKFIDRVQAQKGMELHSLIVLRHGAVIAEGWWKPYTPEQHKMLFSLSKSFTSTAVGFAVSEGLLGLNDPVLPYFRDEAPKDPGEHWQELTVHHLLSMNTGHDEDPTFFMLSRPDGRWTEEFFKHPINRKPGSWFLYNTGATYMLSALVQKLTGKRVLDYLAPRLFEPLGITGAEWDQSPEGYDCGGFGLHIKTEDIARFGQFLLQRGQWEGRQLLSPSWVDRASAAHSDNSNTQSTPDWTAGYGYQFWRCAPGCYRGDGAFGQYCIVMPDQDVVVAITSGVADMQAVLTHLWDCLLPGIGREGTDSADAELASKLAAAAYAPPALRHGSPVEAELSGKSFVLEANAESYRTVRFDFNGGGCDAAFIAGPSEFSLAFGRERWLNGVYLAPVDYNVTPLSHLPVMSSFTWESDSVLLLTARDLHSPFVMTWRAEFAGYGITLSHGVNMSFGKMDKPTMKGLQV